MSVTAPRWITVFVDVPDEDFEPTVRFWAEALGGRVSPARGLHGEFVTVIPSTGHPVLKLQKLHTGAARVHLDLHVDDVDAATQGALAAGAALIADPDELGYAVLRSPAGLAFCFVDDPAAPETDVHADGDRCSLEQVMIDVPEAQFAEETAFWSAITGWAAHGGGAAFPEFGWFEQPRTMPVRLMAQRVGDDTARLHLDLRVPDLEGGVALLERAGARATGAGGEFWRVLQDPAGTLVCASHHQDH